MPERLEVCGLHIPHGAVCGVWDPLFFANLCLGGVGGGGSLTTGNEVTQAPALPLCMTTVRLLPLSGPHQKIWAEMFNKQDVCI